MKIYVVTQVDIDGCCTVQAVFNTSLLAEAYAAEWLKTRCGGLEIEEWDLDAEAGKVMRPAFRAFGNRERQWIEVQEVKVLGLPDDASLPVTREGRGKRDRIYATSFVSADHARELVVAAKAGPA